MCFEFHRINRQKSTLIVRLLTVAGFLFFFGLRGFVNTDWMSYYPYFEKLKTVWDGGFCQLFGASQYEIGFEIYSILIKSICPDYFYWVFVSSLIDVILLDMIFRRHARYYVLAFLVFFVFTGGVIEINLMRNVKSILFFLLSIRYLQERRITPYLLLNGAGVLFHLSAIVYLPLYFILHRTFPKMVFWVIFIIGNLLFLFQIQYIQPVFTFVAGLTGGSLPERVAAYFHHEVFSTPYGITIGYIERFCSFVLVVLLAPQLREQNKDNTVFINLYGLYFICFFYFSETSEVASRMSCLFVGAYWMLYPNLLALAPGKLYRYLLLSLFIVYALLKTGMAHANLLHQYDNLVGGLKSYEERKQLFETHADTIFREERKP
jgi:hypothetical protein